jgi:hypothetical protein
MNFILTKQDSVSSARANELMEKYPTISHFTHKFVGLKLAKLGLLSFSIAVFTLGADKYGTDVVERFMDSYASGEGLSKGDPVLVLREKLLGMRSSVGKMRLNARTMTRSSSFASRRSSRNALRAPSPFRCHCFLL